MTDQSGDEEGVRFARLRRQARRKNVVLLVPSSFSFALFSPAPHVRAHDSIYGSENWSVYKLGRPRRDRKIYESFLFTANDYKPELLAVLLFFRNNWDWCCSKNNYKFHCFSSTLYHQIYTYINFSRINLSNRNCVYTLYIN